MPIRLLVRSGVHEGACLDLKQGTIRVGSAAGNDVVLADCGLAHAFTLHAAGRGIAVEAGEARIEIDGVPLPATQRKLLKRSCELHGGGVALRLDIPEPARAEGGAAIATRHRRTAALLLSAAIVSIAITATSMPRSVARQPAAMDARAARAAAPTAAPAKAGALLEALRRRGQRDGLSSIQFRRGDDGAIVATGWALPGQMAAWREAQRWFDAHAAGQAVLVDQVQPLDAMPRLDIQAVWQGPSPYLIDGSGEKVPVGASLADGWQLAAIEADAVRLQRDGAVVRVRYR
jgi:type III secretion protein D